MYGFSSHSTTTTTAPNYNLAPSKGTFIIAIDIAGVLTVPCIKVEEPWH